MNDNRFTIEPKKTIDIAREWLVVRGWKFPIPRGCFDAMQTDTGGCFDMAQELAEFADLMTKQLSFERDTYKKLAEDALACSPPKPMLIDTGERKKAIEECVQVVENYRDRVCGEHEAGQHAAAACGFIANRLRSIIGL
jgi:hypothetical protein